MIGFRIEKDIERIQEFSENHKEKERVRQTALLAYLVEQKSSIVLDKKEPGADGKSVLERAQETACSRPNPGRNDLSRQTEHLFYGRYPLSIKPSDDATRITRKISHHK
jgi:hypothetical protein